MRRFVPALAIVLLAATIAVGQSREEKVRADKKKVESQGFWIYNDLDKAFRLAKQSNKPILVSLRCIPCEQCVKLDDDLIDNDRVIRPLLEQFVCVRVVGTNGLDLNLFQFDTDQSFAMFMLNADKTIYGRFGTRSHRTEWLGDVSLEGLAEALSGTLALHKNFPLHRESLAAKQGKPLEFATPEQYPTLKTKYKSQLDYQGNVVASCIHCHQIGDARREYYWNRSKPISEELMFPYPHPKAIGLVLDPEKRARVKSVTPGTPTAASALRAGDDILRIDGQPMLSMADVQWVLHNTPSKDAELRLTIRRGDSIQETTLKLPDGWRRLDNPKWRVSTWGPTIMTIGGLRLEPLSNEEKKALAITGDMALRATYVGWYRKQGAAKQAGVRKGDVLVEYNGRSDFRREADLLAYACANLKPGDRVKIKYLRDGKLRTATLPVQKRN